MILKDDPSAQVDAADGKVTLSAPREELILNFPAVKVELNFKMSKKLELFVDILSTNAERNLILFPSLSFSPGKMSFMTNLKGVTEIKLTVYDTNAENDNAVISEIRVPSE